MTYSASSAAFTIASSHPSSPPDHWPTFEDMLYQLHQNGIYLHPHQLAEFLLRHGLPVDLEYVPPHLKQKAIAINSNYQGDMARLEERDDGPWYSEQLGLGVGSRA
ncbi:hypothetical protein [Leptodesmis sp.]|uniref:hypothetical protein n=1 Tax=Leptodesmis sp. TaxID=3100501 RepID=UPI00405351A1